MEYYSALKGNEGQIHAIQWLVLENSMSREIGRAQKVIVMV
jgi:hypothetical protein